MLAACGEPRHVFETLTADFEPVGVYPATPETEMRTHGCRYFLRTRWNKIFMSKASFSSRIDKGPVRGPKAHDKLHRFATGWA